MAKNESSGKLKKALITPYKKDGSLGTEIPVLFYPPNYTLKKSNQFAKVGIPGLESPLLQFTRGDIQTLTMDLFFDTYTDRGGEDVRKHTDLITNLMKIDSEKHAPPVCLFSWSELNFTCVLQQVTQRFTMFSREGIPVRATLSVTFEEHLTAETQVKAKPRSSPDRTKLRTTKAGDSLWLWAAEEYGDPSKWRWIADKNKIENPRFLEPGTEILIPPLEE